MLDEDERGKIIDAWVKANALRAIFVDPQDTTVALANAERLSNEIFNYLDDVVPALMEDSDEELLV
jgi:hypothetical protein